MTDINNILCVGRDVGNRSGTMKYKSQITGFSQTDAEELKLDLHEPRILPIPPSRSAYRDLSPPTKSILRSKSPSPKQGSPLSLRSVRFSDKDGDNDIGQMFTKIHVNETCQTDDIGPSAPITMPVCKLFPPETIPKPVLIRPKPLPYQSKTSTPRNGSSNGIPAVEFKSPREHSPVRIQPFMCTTSPIGKMRQSNKFESEVVDNTTHRQSRKDMPSNSSQWQTPVNYTRTEASPSRTISTQTGMGPENIPDGNRIIRNLDLCASPRPMHHETINENNVVKHISTQTDQHDLSDIDGNFIIKNLDRSQSPRSLSPDRRNQYTLDGHKILQNWTIEKFKSIGTQTKDGVDDQESLRSQSPEYPQADISNTDCSKITQNMELNGIGKANEVACQTNDFMDEKVIVYTTSPNVSIATQTGDDYENEQEETSRSEYVQVNLDESSMDEEEEENVRSIGIQAPEPPIKIPDGNRIIKNIKMSHSSIEKPKGKTVDDPKWADFIRSLQREDSDTDSEPRTSSVSSAKREPVIVYDNKPVDRCSSPKADERAPQHIELLSTEPLSEHSARSLLKGESYKKRQVEQILNHHGFRAGPASSKQPVRKSTSSGTSSKHTSGPTLPVQQYKSPTVSKEPVVPVYSKAESHYLPKEPSNTMPQYSYMEQVLKQSQLQQYSMPPKARSNSLDFTPIETYSFKPETVAAMKTSKKSDTVSSYDERKSESMTKNSIIQGLDLGPLPLSTRKSRSSPSRPDRKSWKYSSFTFGDDCSTRGVSSRNSSNISYKPRASSAHGRYSSPMNSCNRKPSSLTPTLSQMRSSMARKYYSSGTPSPPNGRYTAKSAFSNASNSLATSRMSRYDSFKYSTTSREEESSKRYAKSSFATRTCSPKGSAHYVKSSTISPHRSSSPKQRFLNQRQVSSEAPDYLYIDALQNDSNNRRSSKERSPIRYSLSGSRSRSRSQSPVSTSTNVDREVARYSGRGTPPSSADSYVSLETSRRISRNDHYKSSSRKPPLPKGSKTQRKSSSLERSSGSFCVIGQEPSKPMRENDNLSPQTQLLQEHGEAPLGCTRMSETKVRDKSVDRKTEEMIKSNSQTITIGQTTTGLQNKDCIFLGHDTIQKIIDDAVL